MRLIIACAATLLLAGCGNSNVSQSSLLGAAGGGDSARPKLIVVTDFTFSPDLLVIDRNFTQRLERKIGAFPTYERKQRTVERVNDEIVATAVATLREAGLDAEPGSEEGLTLSKASVVVRGSLRPANPSAKKNEAGIGAGLSGVTADVTLSSVSRFGRKQLLTFSTEPAGGKPASGKLASGKAAAAANASIAAALVAAKAAPEKLSPDVEAVARKFGRGIGEKILAYGKEQGWQDKPEVLPHDLPKAAPEVAKLAQKPEASEAEPAVATAAEALPPKPRTARRTAAKLQKPAPDSADTPAGD